MKSAIQRTIVTVFLFSLSTGYAQPSTQGASHKAAHAVVHPQVELDALVLQFPREAIGQLLREETALSLSAEEVLECFQSGSGKLLHTLKLHTVNGVNAQTEAVAQEVIYPTDFVLVPLPKDEGAVGEGGVIAAEPKNFETREVGAILNFTPMVSPDNQNIQVTLRFELCRLLRWQEHKTSADLSGETSHITIREPVFQSFNTVTSLLLKDGTPMGLGGWGDDEENTVTYLILTASLVDKEEQKDSSIVELSADRINYDPSTKEIRLDGNAVLTKEGHTVAGTQVVFSIINNQIAIEGHPKLKLSDSKESLVLGNGGTIQKILVLGAVHNPGYRPIKQGIAMRLQAAIETSGGLTSEAEESGIRILRPKSNESGKGEGYITLRPVSLSDGESNTFKLQPGDIVFVPKREAITVSGGAKVLDIAENLSTEEVISSLETQNKRVLQEIEMQKEKISALKDRKNVAKLYEAEIKQLIRLEDLHDLLNKRLDTIRNTIKSDSPSKNK